jgi:hypothetical protein
MSAATCMRMVALAGFATAAMVFAPSTAADVPGIAPFTGSWHAHEEGLDIQPDGHRRQTYNDRSTCPDAPTAGCGIGGATDFMLTSVTSNTATGIITAQRIPNSRSADR